MMELQDKLVMSANRIAELEAENARLRQEREHVNEMFAAFKTNGEQQIKELVRERDELLASLEHAYQMSRQWDHAAIRDFLQSSLARHKAGSAR